MSLKNDHVQGDYPLASTINSIDGALDGAHTAMGDSARVYAVKQVSSSRFTFQHRMRYLWFRSTGSIVDPSGVGETVNISDENNAPTKYDLNSVSWLYYGQIYWVTGVSWCIESET